MNHAKAPCFRRAAGRTYVEVQSGGAAVMARVVQAATNPTEGQRMLQAGFDGEILGGESREKISTSSDVDGIVRVDRFVERSVVSEGGQAVLMQQVQQSAQQLPPMPDIEEPLPPSQMSGMVSKAEFDAGMSGIADVFGVIKDALVHAGETLKGSDKQMQGVVTILQGVGNTMQGMADEIVNISKVVTVLTEKTDKTDKKFKDMEEERDANQAKTSAEDKRRRNLDKKRRTDDDARRTKDTERDAERDAKQAERDAERDAKVVVEFEKRLALLQSEPSKKKRPANIQGESVLKKKTKKEEPRNFKKAGKYFQWFKIINGKKHDDKVRYKTLDEAKQGMASYFDNLEQQDNDMTESD